MESDTNWAGQPRNPRVERVFVEKVTPQKGEGSLRGDAGDPTTWSVDDGFFDFKALASFSLGFGLGHVNPGDIVRHCHAHLAGDALVNRHSVKTGKGGYTSTNGYFPRAEFLGESASQTGPVLDVKIERAPQPPPLPIRQPDELAVSALVTAGDALRTLAGSLQKATA